MMRKQKKNIVDVLKNIHFNINQNYMRQLEINTVEIDEAALTKNTT